MLVTLHWDKFTSPDILTVSPSERRNAMHGEAEPGHLVRGENEKGLRNSSTKTAKVTLGLVVQWCI